jgi:antitoxin (DNA-binding transcriptional repressor) of toxin-antitoxin stability system
MIPKYDNLIFVTTHVSATEAVRSFSDLLNRIRYRGEEFVVERAGEPICRMTPAGPTKALSLRDLASLLKQIPKPDAGYASEVRRASRSQGRPPRSPWGR